MSSADELLKALGDVSRRDKADWRTHEADVARRTGGSHVRGSGNQAGKPADVMGAGVLRECKATKGCSIRIRAEWLDKIVSQALVMGRAPVLEIRLEGAATPDWVLIPATDYDELLEEAK